MTYPTTEQIRDLTVKLVDDLLAVAAERDHAVRRAELLNDALSTETARADDFTHGYIELRAGIALCLYLGRLAYPAAPVPASQDDARDAEKCRHSNSTFVRETADWEAERWVCYDCGVFFTKEVPT